MLQLTKWLCSMNAVSGWEDEVRCAIASELREYADALEQDVLGNLMVWKSGAVHLPQPLMLTAHMDEVGLMITGYREEGFLRFAFVGDVDARSVLGKQVALGEARIPGVVGQKAFHLLKGSEREGIPAAEELYIDIGAESEEEARQRIKPGWRGSFVCEGEALGQELFKAAALDGRCGCAALIDLCKKPLPVDCCFVFTVQKEVGCRGAAVAAGRIKPALALVMDGVAAGLPGADNDFCRLGMGVALPLMSGGAVTDHRLYRRVTDTARRHSIPWQCPGKVSGHSDAAAFQGSGTGALTMTLALPVRNRFTPACVGHKQDILAMPQLAMAILEDISHGYYDL